MSKHTPGPWRFANGDKFDDDFLEPPEYQYLVLAAIETPDAIASFWDSEWGDEAKANACLIAAAPDLLAALKDLERVSGLPLMYNDLARIAARAAIAKATGADNADRS